MYVFGCVLNLASKIAFFFAPKLFSRGERLRPSWKKMRPEKWSPGSAQKIRRLAQKRFFEPCTSLPPLGLSDHVQILASIPSRHFQNSLYHAHSHQKSLVLVKGQQRSPEGSNYGCKLGRVLRSNQRQQSLAKVEIYSPASCGKPHPPADVLKHNPTQTVDHSWDQGSNQRKASFVSSLQEEVLSRSMEQIPASKKRRRIPPQKSKLTLCSEQAGGRFVTRERPAGKPRGVQLQMATVTDSAAKFDQAKASRYSGSVRPQSNFTESYNRLGQSWASKPGFHLPVLTVCLAWCCSAHPDTTVPTRTWQVPNILQTSFQWIADNQHVQSTWCWGDPT